MNIELVVGHDGRYWAIWQDDHGAWFRAELVIDVTKPALHARYKYEHLREISGTSR